jgi:hypothetical protein
MYQLSFDKYLQLDSLFSMRNTKIEKNMSIPTRIEKKRLIS